MKTPPGLSSFLIYWGKKYATAPVISSPGLCPTFSLPALAAPISRPKAGTVGEGRMAELGRESMIERMLAMNTAADRTDQRNSQDQLFFSTDIDGGMQGQMI
jgi:hypothetical protein